VNNFVLVLVFLGEGEGGSEGGYVVAVVMVGETRTTAKS